MRPFRVKFAPVKSHTPGTQLRELKFTFILKVKDNLQNFEQKVINGSVQGFLTLCFLTPCPSDSLSWLLYLGLHQACADNTHFFKPYNYGIMRS